MRDFTNQRFVEEHSANPFLEDLFVDHPTQLPGVARIHHAVFSQILESVESLLQRGDSGRIPAGLGRLFLLTAPEAGYGKSHLVARLRDHLGAIASTLFLPFDRSRPVTWPVALTSTLRQFTTLTRTRHLSVTLLEEFSRYFLSRLVLDCLESGMPKPRECPENASRVKAEFVSLFGPDSDSKILSWLDKRTDDLTRHSDPEFSRRLGMGQSELAFWTRVFVDLNLREHGTLDRLRGLSNGEARERLLQLLRIATDHRPVMLVADGLDGFHHSDTAGMEIAEILNGIREKVPRTVSLVCVNDDVWSSVFANRLPGAWLDRLNVETMPLRPIGPEAATDLVCLRLRHTRISESAAAKFAQRLGDDHLWIDAQTRLTPRTVLRQASNLWRREAKALLARPFVQDDYEDLAEGPLANLTDKAAFFAELQREGEPAAAPRTAEEEMTPPLASEATAPGSFISSPAPARDRRVDSEPQNDRFQADPEPIREVDLTGIDSIINDIRGTGKTVMSETQEQRFGAEPPQQPQEPVASPSHDAAFTPPPVPHPVREPERENEGPSFGEFTPPMGGHAFPGTSHAATAPAPSPRTTAPITRAALEQMLAQRERELLAGPALALDLERFGRFVRTAGATHAALSQQEERHPSSRTVCLRWSARSHSVLSGFESPRNIYFWNNLLQQSLASNRQEKIAAFSHDTEPFDPSLFASFGFSPAVIRGRVDIIEMKDRELAMIYAADSILRDSERSADAEKIAQLITLHLDPFWRRIIQPL